VNKQFLGSETQHDASELLISLLDSMSKNLNSAQTFTRSSLLLEADLSKFSLGQIVKLLLLF